MTPDEIALLDALETFVRTASDAHDHWENDRDHKAAKHLAALGGFLKGYSADIDAIHELITRMKARTP